MPGRSATRPPTLPGSYPAPAGRAAHPVPRHRPREQRQLHRHDQRPGPQPQTQVDCQIYTNFIGTGPIVSPGQAVGTGCVFPSSVPTVASQLTAAGRDWKGYAADVPAIFGADVFTR